MKKTKQITTTEYAKKLGISRIWASTLIRRMHKYGEAAPKVEKVEMISNRYLITVK